jgi:hypothetical protein
MFSGERPPSSVQFKYIMTTLGPPLAAGVAFTPHSRFDVPSSGDDVMRHAVLVFSSDPLAAALVGAAVELAGHMPHFVREGEAARSALLRVRPRLIIIDCDHAEACSDEFVGPALMTAAQVLLFRSRRTVRNASGFAERLSLRVMDMPIEHEQLTTVLNELLPASSNGQSV